MVSVSLLFILVVAAAAVAAAVAWLAQASRQARATALLAGDVQRLAAERDAVSAEKERLMRELASLRDRLESEQKSRIIADTERQNADKVLESTSKLVAELKQQMEGTYAKLSQEALKAAVDQLSQNVKPHLDGTKGEIVSSLDTKKSEIEGLLTPVREMLERYRSEVALSEKLRSEAYGGLQEQIRGLLDAQEKTQKETAKLSSALRVPNVRGSWGENTLRNCVEMAGMSEFCDFEMQQTFEAEDGKRLRPDMVVRLPNKRVIAVDSKAPIDAFLEAAGESDEARRKTLIDQHARNLRKHIDALSRKEYQASVGETLDFTVLFLAGEQFLSSALLVDPTIFEFAVERKIFLATPTVLLPLLRAVAAGWKAERQEESARQALVIGLELYDRFVKVFEHFDGVGSALENAVKKYNETIRSVQGRLLPKARQLQMFVDSTREMPPLEQLELGPVETPKVLVEQVRLPIREAAE
jgi:DNA recombination protein RmuC